MGLWYPPIMCCYCTQRCCQSVCHPFPLDMVLYFAAVHDSAGVIACCNFQYAKGHSRLACKGTLMEPKIDSLSIVERPAVSQTTI